MIEFKRRDFLYNSGLVNMFLFLYEDCANKKKEDLRLTKQYGNNVLGDLSKYPKLV